MGVGVATTDAFRHVIIQPGHYYIGADSPDSSLQIRAGAGISIQHDIEQQEIVFSNTGKIACLSRQEILEIKEPPQGQIVAVIDNGIVESMAVYTGNTWRKIDLGSTL
jgi:hypothetical protein